MRTRLEPKSHGEYTKRQVEGQSRANVARETLCRQQGRRHTSAPARNKGAILGHKCQILAQVVATSEYGPMTHSAERQDSDKRNSASARPLVGSALYPSCRLPYLLSLATKNDARVDFFHSLFGFEIRLEFRVLWAP